MMDDPILADLERKRSPARSIIGKTLNFDGVKDQYKARFIEWLRMKTRHAKGTPVQSNDCDCVECQCSRCPDIKAHIARSLIKHPRLVELSCDCEKCTCTECPVIPPQLVKFHDKYKDFKKRLKQPNAVSCSTSIDDPGLPGCDCLDCQDKRKDPLKYIISSLSDTERKLNKNKRDVSCATSLTNFGHAVLCDCVECQHDRAKQRKNLSKRTNLAAFCDCPCTHQEEGIERSCELCQCLHIPNIGDTVCYCPVCNCFDGTFEEANGKECDCEHCKDKHDCQKCDCLLCQCKDESVCEEEKTEICEQISKPTEETEEKNIMVCKQYPKTVELCKGVEFECDCVICQCPGRSNKKLVDDYNCIEEFECTCDPCNCGVDECKYLDPNIQGLDFPCEEDTCPFYLPKDGVLLDETCPSLNEIISEAKARKERRDNKGADEGKEDPCTCNVCDCAFCLADHGGRNELCDCVECKCGSDRRLDTNYCNCVECVCKSCNKKILTTDESDKEICHCLTCDCRPCQRRKSFTSDMCKVQSCDCDTCKKPILGICECCTPCECDPCKSLKSGKCECDPCTKCDYCTLVKSPSPPLESACNCGKCDCLMCTKLNKPRTELKCICDPCKCYICKATRTRYYCGCDPGECECTECDLNLATVECVCSLCECSSCLNEPCTVGTNLPPLKEEPPQTDEPCKCCGPCPCKNCKDKSKQKIRATLMLMCAKCQKIMKLNKNLYEKSQYSSNDPKSQDYVSLNECLLCHLPKLLNPPESNPDCICYVSHLKKTDWIKELMPFGPFSESYREKIKDSQKKSDAREQEINTMKDEVRTLQLKFKRIKGFDPLAITELCQEIEPIKHKMIPKTSPPPNVMTLKLQIMELQEKCMVKDQIIDKIVKNIKQGSVSIVDEISKERLISDCKRIDYNRQKVADRLLSETEEAKKKIFQGSDGSNVGLVVIRRIGERSIMVKWDLPKHGGVIGYELFSNGESLQKIYSPSRSIALIRNLPDVPKVELSLKCMTENGHLPKSSNITYIPEEFNEETRESSINWLRLQDTNKSDIIPTLSHHSNDNEEVDNDLVPHNSNINNEITSHRSSVKNDVASRHSNVNNDADTSPEKNVSSENGG